MPLKDGPMLQDDEVDVSAASKVDRSTCNKLICNLGYTNEDNIRYPKVIQQVYAKLKQEEGGDGNKAQQRHLYKKLTQCNPNYPEAKDIPSRRECNSSPTPNTFYNRQQSPPKTQKSNFKKPRPTPASIAVSKDNIRAIYEFIDGPTKDSVNDVFKRITELEDLLLTTSHMISKTHDEKLHKQIKVVHSNVVRINKNGDYGDAINSELNWKTLNVFTKDIEEVFLKFYKKLDKDEDKQNRKSARANKGPKGAKQPTPPRDPTPPKKSSSTKTRNSPKDTSNSKKKRCPKGTRRNKKSGICEPPKKSGSSKEPSEPRKSSSSKKRNSPPKNTSNSTKKRCPNGTRRNRKTGNCEPK